MKLTTQQLGDRRTVTALDDVVAALDRLAMVRSSYDTRRARDMRLDLHARQARAHVEQAREIALSLLEASQETDHDDAS